MKITLLLILLVVSNAIWLWKDAKLRDDNARMSQRDYIQTECLRMNHCELTKPTCELRNFILDFPIPRQVLR